MKIWVVVVQMAQQHAELGAPITNVVDTKDVVPTTKKNHVGKIRIMLEKRIMLEIRIMLEKRIMLEIRIMKNI